MRVVRTGAIVALACVALSTRRADAQTTPQANAVARSEFSRGVADTAADRWDSALAHFTRAYSLLRQPRILLNVAGAQARTGRLVASAESYRTFLRTATGAAFVPMRASANEALAEVLRRTPHVRLGLAGVHPIDRVALDDVTLAHAVLGIELPVDPGHHALLVTRGERAVGRAEFDVDAGAARDVRLVLLGLPDPQPVAHRGGPPASVFASPWLWTGVGVVAVTGAVVAIVFATRPAAPPNTTPPTDSFVVPLH